MTRRGEFRNLYVLGYDTPEGYAIAKDGKMYYAFFARTPQAKYQGAVQLRGLEPGTYRVFDYVNHRDLGTVSASRANLETQFTGSLLLEVSKQ